MSENEIKAANAILSRVSPKGVRYGEIRVMGVGAGFSEADIEHAAIRLQDDKFIRISPPTPKYPQALYEFEQKAIDFKRDGKRYEDYLSEQESKSTKQLEREERDDQIKDYTLKDLKIRVDYLHKMQWIYWIIAIVGVVLSLAMSGVALYYSLNQVHK